ncbi:MAG: two component transcriptional regulator, winged helix family [Verrucomicrobiales bacterium]|nr:two component transcriptional regulator, winged helix family [Verrucomicrobiales bacterium]
MKTILVVDDEADALELISYNLKQAGFSVATSMDGADALAKARSLLPALIILDVMLPEMDGFEVCKTLRREAATEAIPIIMLTAKTAEMDRVLGLELGSDDYVTKPFSPRELVLRVRKLLDRTHVAAQQKDQLRVGDLLIDVPRHAVTLRGRPLDFTATEFKLLLVLVQRCGLVQSRERLLRDVWEYERDVDTRTVDTHVRRLRDKLGRAAPFLDTVRGVGYRYMDE